MNPVLNCSGFVMNPHKDDKVLYKLNQTDETVWRPFLFLSVVYGSIRESTSKSNSRVNFFKKLKIRDGGKNKSLLVYRKFRKPELRYLGRCSYLLTHRFFFNFQVHCKFYKLFSPDNVKPNSGYDTIKTGQVSIALRIKTTSNRRWMKCVGTCVDGI